MEFETGPCWRARVLLVKDEVSVGIHTCRRRYRSYSSRLTPRPCSILHCMGIYHILGSTGPAMCKGR